MQQGSVLHHPTVHWRPRGCNGIGNLECSFADGPHMLDEGGRGAGSLQEGNHVVLTPCRHIVVLIGSLHCRSPSLDHCAVYPPSRAITCPVIMLEAALARYSTVPT